MEEWQHTLKNGTIQELPQALEEIREAYGNLLDLDGAGLSEDFVKDTKNLKLMEEAMNGNEQAYNRLLDLAERDLEVQFGINDDSIAQIDEAGRSFEDLRNIVNQGVDDVEIGCAIDDTAAIQAMNELINAAGLTADQATELLSSMGVDAEVEEKTIEKEDLKTFVSAKPTVENIPIYRWWF